MAYLRGCRGADRRLRPAVAQRDKREIVISSNNFRSMLLAGPDCDRAFTVRSGLLSVLAVRSGRLAVRGAAGRHGVDTGPGRIEPGLSGKRDRACRQPCRERHGLPESAGQWPPRMT